MHKKLEIVETRDGRAVIFTVYKLGKHVSVNNHDQTACSAGRPGDYLIVDPFYTVMVMNRKEFKTYFGHKRMELLDEP